MEMYTSEKPMIHGKH